MTRPLLAGCANNSLLSVHVSTSVLLRTDLETLPNAGARKLATNDRSERKSAPTVEVDSQRTQASAGVDVNQTLASKAVHNCRPSHDE